MRPLLLAACVLGLAGIDGECLMKLRRGRVRGIARPRQVILFDQGAIEIK